MAPVPELLQPLLDLLRSLLDVSLASTWLLPAIVVFALVDALLPIVPSEALIIGDGVSAAAGGQSLLVVIAAAATGAFAGEVASYALGRWMGPSLRRRWTAGSARRAVFDRMEHALRTRGLVILLTARYVPGARTVATVAAGATSYPLPRFLAAVAVGGLMSSTYVALLGFVGGTAFADDTVAALLVSFGMALAVGGLLEVGRRVRRRTGAVAVPA